MGQTRGELRRSLLWATGDGTLITAATGGETDSIGQGTTVITDDYNGPVTALDSGGNALEAEGWLVAMSGAEAGFGKAIASITEDGVNGRRKIFKLQIPFRGPTQGGERFEVHRHWAPEEKNSAINDGMIAAYPHYRAEGIIRLGLTVAGYYYSIPVEATEIEGVTVGGRWGRQSERLQRGRDYIWDIERQQIILRRALIASEDGWLEVSYRRPVAPLQTDTDTTEIPATVILEFARKFLRE